MPAPDRSRGPEHIVVMLFENRSLDNVLGTGTARGTARPSTGSSART